MNQYAELVREALRTEDPSQFADASYSLPHASPRTEEFGLVEQDQSSALLSASEEATSQQVPAPPFGEIYAICDISRLPSLLENQTSTQLNIEDTSLHDDGTGTRAAPLETIADVDSHSIGSRALTFSVRNRFFHYCNKPTSYLAAAVMLILVILTRSHVNHAPHDRHDRVPPHVPPADDSLQEWIVTCARQISGETAPNDPASPQSAAVRWLSTRTFFKQQCSHRFRELYGLVVIRESLKVPDAKWKQNTEQVCRWPRVHCDGNCSVTGLSLEHANLTGSIPPEVAALKHLTSFEAYSNIGLTGSLPTALANVTSLTRLKLHQTSLKGTLPSTLGEITLLEELLVDATLLTGELPSEICRLPALRHLNLPLQINCSCSRDNLIGVSKTKRRHRRCIG